MRLFLWTPGHFPKLAHLAVWVEVRMRSCFCLPTWLYLKWSSLFLQQTKNAEADPHSAVFPYSLFAQRYLLGYVTGRLETRSLGIPHVITNSGLAAYLLNSHEVQIPEINWCGFLHISAWLQPCSISSISCRMLPRWDYPLGLKCQRKGKWRGWCTIIRSFNHFRGFNYHDWLSCQSHCHQIIALTASPPPLWIYACVTLGKVILNSRANFSLSTTH